MIASRVVQVGDRGVRLAGDAQLIERSRLLVFPLPCDELREDELVLLERDGGRVRATGAFGRLESCDDDELLTHLDYVLASTAVLTPGAVCSLHAACVSFGDRTLLLLGSHGQGKTTLAMALAQLGGMLLTDDLAHLRSEPLGVRPVSRAVRVRADSARALGLSLTGAEREYIAPHRGPDGWLVPTDCVEVCYEVGRPAQLSTLSRRDATTSVMRSIFKQTADRSATLRVASSLMQRMQISAYVYGHSPANGARELLAALGVAA